jgi:hypothetical protein
LLQLGAVETAAKGFGVSVQVFEARRVADIAEALWASTYLSGRSPDWLKSENPEDRIVVVPGSPP